MDGSREALIELRGEKRADGSYIVHSPQIPLLHAVAASYDEILDTVLPIIKEMIRRQFNVEVEFRTIEALSLDGESDTGSISMPPAHVIAVMDSGSVGANSNG